MQTITSWLMSLFFGSATDDDQERFAQRKNDLQQRLERLEREVDVIQRAQTREEPDA